MRFWWVMWLGGCDYKMVDVPPDVVIDEESPQTPNADADADEIPIPETPLSIRGIWHVDRSHTIAFDNTRSVLSPSVSGEDFPPRGIATHDNAERWLIYSDGVYVTDAGRRLDWFTHASGVLHLCETPTEDTVETLMNMASPESTDVENGCHSGPWQVVRPDVPLPESFVIDNWLLTNNSFELHDPTWEDDYPIAVHEAGKPWLVVEMLDPSDGSSTGDGFILEWTESDDKTFTCLIVEPIESDWTSIRTRIDETDLETGCNGDEWDELKLPFEARGDYQTLFCGIPNHLYESTSFTRNRMGTELSWNVLEIDHAAGTMVMEAETIESGGVSPDSRFIKIQVAKDPAGDRHVCLLAAEASRARAAAAPTTTLDDPDACDTFKLGSNGGWYLLTPE